MALGKAIQQAREMRGLKPAELAGLVPMSIQALCNMESRDSQRSQFATRIAEVLRVSLPDLLAGRVVEGTPLTKAIRSEKQQDGLSLIEQGLKRLLIVGAPKDEIMALVHKHAKTAAETQAAVMEALREKQ